MKSLLLEMIVFEIMPPVQTEQVQVGPAVHILVMV